MAWNMEDSEGLCRGNIEVLPEAAMRSARAILLRGRWLMLIR